MLMLVPPTVGVGGGLAGVCDREFWQREDVRAVCEHARHGHTYVPGEQAVSLSENCTYPSMTLYLPSIHYTTLHYTTYDYFERCRALHVAYRALSYDKRRGVRFSTFLLGVQIFGKNLPQSYTTRILFSRA